MNNLGRDISGCYCRMKAKYPERSEKAREKSETNPWFDYVDYVALLNNTSYGDILKHKGKELAVFYQRNKASGSLPQILQNYKDLKVKRGL
jgi:hypothetical protein